MCARSLPILWLLGLHYAYFGKWSMLVFFWLTAGGVGFWWIVDAFRMRAMVEDANKDIASEVCRGMMAVGT